MDEKALAVVSTEVSLAVQAAQQVSVVTKEDYIAAIALRNRVKTARASWVAYWKELKDSAYATWKGLCAKENEKTVILDQILAVVDQKALDWKQAADRKIAEEQARLNAAAQEKARREKEAAIKAAEKLKTPELKEARLAEAETIIPPEIILESATAGVKGASSRKTWKAKLVDLRVLIESAKSGTVSESLLDFNQKAADAFARSTKGKIFIPGVEFFEEESLSSRQT